MPDNAVSIVREFVNAPEPQLRRNACVGLAALGGAEALELLVGRATEDEDASVRAWAAKEIAELPAYELETAERLLVAALQRPTGSTWTYAAASRLVASRGLRFAGIPPLTALHYAWRATAVEVKGERVRQFWQTCGLLSAGMIVGWILIAALCGVLKVKAYSSGYEASAMVFLQVSLVLLLSLLTSLRLIHWEAQAKVEYASALELCMTAAGSCVVALITAAMVFFNKSEFSPWFFSSVRLLFLGAASFTLARAVSLGLLHRTPYKWVWVALRFLAAWWSGALLILAFSFHKPDVDLESLYSPLFAFALPLLLGLALVFVFRDRTYAAPTAALGKPMFFITVILLAGSVLAVSYRLLHTRMRPPSATGQNQMAVQVTPNSGPGAVLIGRKPVTVRVLQNDMKVTASMPGAHRLHSFVNGSPGRSDTTDDPTVSATVHENDIVTITEEHDIAPSLLSRTCKILGRPDPGSGTLKLDWTPVPPKLLPALPVSKSGNTH